ncbi:MAG: flavin reductase family protein [Woeseiaceae bacterium]|nr:flavin reductase family protein [Woeseiaceae bacterium]
MIPYCSFCHRRPGLSTTDDPQIDSSGLRRALSCFATGVAIATTLDERGERVGMTISSFSSVSLNPPLVLWSIAHAAHGYDAFIDAEHFAINVLAKGQEQLSERFATRGLDKFEGLSCRDGRYGSPILPEYAACFECRTEHRYDGGDHKIIVGRVLRFDERESEPLIRYRSSFLPVGESCPSIS